MTDINPGIVIFDIDGTLTDSVAQHQRAFEIALRTFSFPNLRTDWGNYTHHTDSAIFEQAWQEAQFDGRADVPLLESRYQQALEAETAERPFTEIAGATRFLQWLKAHGWLAVFATGSLRFGAVKKLQALGVAAEEVDLVTASELTTREDILREAIRLGRQRLSVTGGPAILSVGDGVWDLTTSQNLNLPFIGIGSDAKSQLLRDRGAVVFDDFDHLMCSGLNLLQ